MRASRIGFAVIALALQVTLSVTLSASSGCSSNGTNPPGGDAGGADGATNTSCTLGAPGPTSSSGFALQTFCVPNDPGGGGIVFAASGEVLALTGYDFPPAQPDNAAFVDGWEVKFTRLLTTINTITLSNNPDKVPGDQAQSDAVVAEVDGPWAVDLSHKDPSYLAGKGAPGEQAVPIAALSSQNKNGGAAFATDGTRYAFGFDLVPASASAQNVNIDGAGLEDYKQMVTDQCAVLYVGTATFKGDKTNKDCYPDSYKSWPDHVSFKLCFKSPTSYSNCQNPDNKGTAFPNEESQRGIAFLSDKSIIGQITIHTDHPFWDSVLHDSPAHFDQFAARAVGLDGGATPTVTLEMTKGVDYTAVTDALGNELSWRYCMDPPTDVHPKFTGTMKFDAQSVPHTSGGDPASGLRDYYDFATYNQSTQGHLNSDGLCAVKHNYPSPP
jgi:hypothetical protein